MTRSRDSTGTAEDEKATYTDFGEAISRLQRSMDDLSSDMSGLGEATAKLEASTRELSEKQGEISAQMARTADEIRGATSGPNPRAGQHASPAPADD